MARLTAIALSVLASLWFAGPGLAQSLGVPVSAILTIDSDRMFSESLFGQRVAQELEAERSILRAENRQMEAQLVEEEKQLTAKRKEMTPEEFRAVADAFDARVQDIRRFQDNKASEIAQMQDRQEALFVQAARPVLEDLMREARASVILEQRTILLSASAVDITDQAITRLNTAIGDGHALQNEQP